MATIRQSSRPQSARASALAPLAHPVFRGVWLASMASNFGGLIQSVGASWLMTSIADSADMVAQQQLGVAQPDFGVLFDDMLVPDRGQIDTRRLIQPKVEAEVALVLGRDIDVLNPTVLDVLRAVAFALPALEIVDSRVRNWDITIVDTVADNASSGLFVLGSTPTSLSGVDLRACEMTLRVDERVVSKGAGKACLDHPLNALRWLAATVARLGDPLREGEVILTGALGPMAILPAAALVEATVTGLGSVTVSTSTME